MASIEGSHLEISVSLDDTIVGEQVGDYRELAPVRRRSNRLHYRDIEMDWPCQCALSSL